MDFIHIKTLLFSEGKADSLLQTICNEVFDLKLGGGNQSLLISGFQSAGTLFVEPHGSIATLEKMLRKEVAAYVAPHSKSDCLFIQEWPQEYVLKGWYILMEQGGYLKPHNHPTGWLSGVIYLKMPTEKGNEANIEFGLHGKDFPILNHDYPRKTYQVTEGDLVLFPSSLFHRTIPFTSDEDRLCIAFDVTPLPVS